MQVTERSLGGWCSGLDADARSTLWRIVHDSLAWAVSAPKTPFRFDSYNCAACLQRRMASFVTLHDQAGALRGCIGTLEARAPLYRSVHENAVAAALHDPRFPPLIETELPETAYTISILSACEPIEGPDAFVPGQQGIILEQTGRRAVFLPEVAPEQGWSRQQTLAALCRKAGLAPQAWKAPEARFQIFFSSVLSGE